MLAGTDSSTSFISTLSRELDTDVRIIDGEVLRLGAQTVSQFQLGLSAVGRAAPERIDEYAQWFTRNGLGFSVPEAEVPA